MRILAIMPELPYPLDDGIKLRAFHFLRELAGNHEVSLLHFGQADADVREVERYTARHRTVIGAAADPRPAGGIGRALRAMRLGYVWPVDRAMAAAVNEALDVFAPDVIWCTHLAMAGYARFCQRRRTIVDIIDDQVFHRQQQPSRPGVVGKVGKLKLLLDVGLNETRCGCRAAVATFASALDARAFRKWAPWLRCEVVVNGVDTAYFQPAAGPVADSPYVVFVGNYRHPPNVGAVGLLARSIWPLARRQMPGLRCLVVGPHLPEALRREATLAGVEVVGWVDDIRPYLAGATAFVSPLVSGQGVKNKVLEAWAMGRAVVALPAGVAGLEEHAVEAAVVARDQGEFVRCLKQVVDDEPRRRRLGEAGRRIVQQHYTWPRCAGRFRKLIEGLRTAV